MRIAAAALLVSSCWLSCGPLHSFIDDPTQMEDGGTGGDPDMTTPPGRPCAVDNPCPQDRICYQNRCVPDLGTCCRDDDCENDSHCTVKDGSGASCGSHCAT